MRFLLTFLLLAPSAFAQQFPNGTRLRLTALPAADASFSGWSGFVSGAQNPVEIVLSSDASVTATFVANEPPPPPPPPDPVLTVNVVGPGTVTAVVVPVCGNAILEGSETCEDGNVTDGDGCSSTCEVEAPPPPPPPPPPAGGFAAQIICPSGGGFLQPTTTIPNDPVGDGCLAAPMDVSVFFTGTPYDCAHLKPGNFYLGSYPWSDGGSISSRECREVTDGPGFRAAALAHGSREQMVMIIRNDLNLVSADFANWASKGELLVLGIPDASGKPPRLVSTGVTPFNWHSTSGNMALVNLVDPGEIGFGSAHNPQKQTLTLAGVTQTHGPSRLILTRFEGGGGASSAPDPLLPIDDEVYFRNVMAKAGPNSHNIYLDRNGLHYMEGVVSYGNPGDGYHPLKTEAKLSFLYGSFLGSAGVHDVLPNDNSGQSPLSTIACQSGVYRGNKFLAAIGVQGGSPAVHQIRVAIAGCDYPQGWQSNTYPTVPYTGPVNYRGTIYASSPYWDPAWWAGVAAAGTSPPELYSNPDMLVVYHIENTYEVLNSGTTNTSNYYGLLSQPTFPTTYPSTSQVNTPRWTPDAPPSFWFERLRLVLANNCFVSGNPAKVANHWPPVLSCNDPTRPAWANSLPACADGVGPADDTDKFIMLGANQCGTTDPIPAEVAAAVAALEALPNPPWRHWQ